MLHFNLSKYTQNMKKDLGGKGGRKEEGGHRISRGGKKDQRDGVKNIGRGT